jgi:hypothetical protein
MNMGDYGRDAATDVNDEHCFVCNTHKTRALLLLCDSCPNSCHLECAGLRRSPKATAAWYCRDCYDKKSHLDTEDFGETAPHIPNTKPTIGAADNKTLPTVGNKAVAAADNERGAADAKRGDADKKRSKADEMRDELGRQEASGSRHHPGGGDIQTHRFSPQDVK